MNLEKLLLDKRNLIYRIAKKHGAYNVRIFGSVARKEADSDSDIDFLVDLEPGRSLLDLGGLLMYLQELLVCKVDVVTEIFILRSLLTQCSLFSNRNHSATSLSPSFSHFPFWRDFQRKTDASGFDIQQEYKLTNDSDGNGQQF